MPPRLLTPLTSTIRNHTATHTRLPKKKHGRETCEEQASGAAAIPQKVPAHTSACLELRERGSASLSCAAAVPAVGQLQVKYSAPV